MFFPKSTLLFSFLALCHIVVATDTPSCLISALGSQGNPADLAALCGSGASKLQSKISDECGDNAQAALEFFSKTCADAGHKVDIKTSTSGSSTTSSTGTASASSGFVTATSTSSASGSDGSGSSSSGSGTSDSSSGSSTASGPLHTGAASSNKQVSAAAFAAVVFVGFAATL